MSDSQCIIGEKYSVSCQSDYLGASKGFMAWALLEEAQKASILLHVNGKFGFHNEHLICNHHIKELSFCPSVKNKYRDCLNLLGFHTKPIKTEALKICRYFKYLQNNSLGILPGMRVCPKCVQKYECDKLDKQQSERESKNDPEWTPLHDTERFSKLNAVLELLNLSPFFPNKLNKVKQRRAISNKIGEIVTALVNDLSLHSVEVDNYYSTDNISKVKYCNDLFPLIKSKLLNVPYREKCQLLTLCPPFFSTKKIISLFTSPQSGTVSQFLVRKSKALRKEKGILALPPKNRGRPLSDGHRKAVSEFYRSDENSRQMPGMRDVVRVKRDGIWVSLPKKLLVHKLKDTHSKFLKTHPEHKIGLSVFCSLRPKDIILVNSKGVHNVCVCAIHGNVELMLSALGKGREERQKLSQFLVCDLLSFECMTGICVKCRKDEEDSRRKLFDDFVKSILTSFQLKNNYVRYSRWVQAKSVKEKPTKTDSSPEKPKQWESCFEKNRIVSVSLFLDEMYAAFQKLLPHHYITKIQSAEFKRQKEQIPNGTAVVLVDFSENYSFFIQEEAQSFNWDNSQATVHPIVAYFNYKGVQKIISSAVISEHMKHNTMSFFCFQKVFLDYLKVQYPGAITHIEYWSDGCAGQYKNSKNFLNLIYHSLDHNITANWNFSATSHGKNACDGIGAVVKHQAKLYSLRQTCSDGILTPFELYDFSRKNSEKVIVFYLNSYDPLLPVPSVFPSVMAISEQFDLQNRFKRARTFPGTQLCHRVEAKGNQIYLFRTSICKDPFLISKSFDILNSNNFEPIEAHISLTPTFELLQNEWIVVPYGPTWYIAQVDEADKETGAVKITYMINKGDSKSYNFPEDKKFHKGVIDCQDILCKVNPYKGTTHRTASLYFISEADRDLAETSFEMFLRKKKRMTT
jgi:hypothetical protein